MFTPFDCGVAQLVQVPLGSGSSTTAFRTVDGSAGRGGSRGRSGRRQRSGNCKVFTNRSPSAGRARRRIEAYEVTSTLMKYSLLLMAASLGMAVCSAQTPTVISGGVVNGASFAKGQPVSPGGLVSIFGTGLVSKLAVADTIPLSSSLGGVTVTFADLPAAPLLAVIPGVPGKSDDQINAQLPWEVGSGTGVVNVMVTNGQGTSTSIPVNFAPSMPGIFTASAGGQLYAIAVNNSDSTL